MLMSDDDKERLYYGALIHDIGMITIPREIVDAPRKLTPEEITLLRTHVVVAQKILDGRMQKRVVDIALAHHERGDGSGYPAKLRDFQMNQQQRILQVADTVAGLTNERSYRQPLPKEKVIVILNEEVAKNKMNNHVVRTFIKSYDEIMKRVQIQSADIMRMYQTLNSQYDQITNRFKI